MHAHACAQSLARPGDFDRARTLYEKVLRARPYRQLLFYALNNLALLAVTLYLLQRGKPWWFTGVPMVALLAASSKC